MQATYSPNRILRLPSVKARTGLSRSTIYLRIAEGTFPKQLNLGARAIGWLEGDINAWIEGLVSGHRSPFAGTVHSQPSSSAAPPFEGAAPTRSKRSCRERRSADGDSAV